MRNNVKTKTLLLALIAVAMIYAGTSLAPAKNRTHSATEAKSQACPNDDSGLQLPAGFCATVFADDVGHARHMVAAPNGVLYVNTWSGSTATTRRMQVVSSWPWKTRAVRARPM
jgi:glucose/arabinose dehydrogenase